MVVILIIFVDMNAKNCSLNELINMSIKGHNDYRQELYNRYKNKLFVVCLRYANDKEQAEDFLHNGFIQIYKNLHNFRGEGSFEGWLSRIVTNESLTYFRKNKLSLSKLHDTYDSVSDSNTFEDMCADDLLKIINSLPNGFRTVFNMYAIDGYNHKEIAEKLNISEGTSKSQLSRARTWLQNKLKKIEKIEKIA